MNGYAVFWRSAWIAVACVTGTVAFVMWPVSTGIIFGISAGMGVLLAVHRDKSARRATSPRGNRDRSLPFVGFQSGVATIGIVGCTRLAGVLVWLFVLLVLVSSPWALSGYRRLTGAVASGPGNDFERRSARTGRTNSRSTSSDQQSAYVSSTGFGELLQGVNDAQLCEAWFESLELLEMHGAKVNQVVMYRQACLDELERRHPREIRKWLDSEPEPGASPARYFHTR
ncbi:hypothetical protein [Spelaeicoccus albus]|uniref:Uncharacterized protein n=1 Tax=Spelaeicoccus albus TaxID=1280376 RepID=A0A7Z0D4M0_9MICO|nr:hypothetical protein [Spelaeicoccus albus]NYI68755.1 hypothetical protein [Spelaeicoccus albus]